MLTFWGVENGGEDEWLRVARRVLAQRPAVIGLVAVGAPLDTSAVARQLARAMARLTGLAIGVFPHWRCWRQTAGVAEVVPADSGDVVVLSPTAETDGLVAAAALETTVARASQSFAHLVVDLSGLPLRHPATLGSVDAIVTVAVAGGVREDHLLALGRVLPSERNLGVMLIE